MDETKKPTDYTKVETPAKAEKSEDSTTDKPQIQATIRKKKTGSIVKDAIFGNGPDSVKSFLIQDILIPGLKTFVSNAANSITAGVNNGINKALYGQNAQPRYGQEPPWRTRQPYRYGAEYSPSQRVMYNQAANYQQHRETRPIVEDLAFSTYMAAKAALEQIEDYITAYGSISVAQYYDICHVSTVFTQNNYGWTTTRDMTISEYFDHEMGQEMYTIQMPPPGPLH